MYTDPSLTNERIQALNAVNLQLHGVIHGITKSDESGRFVERIDDSHYAHLQTAVDRLDPERGDVLAVEPTGFLYYEEVPTLGNVTSLDIPTYRGAL